ncbi:hypothetical protein AAC691_15475 [Nguyenibacter vanlangensis]|uniref:Uncharacterized protein n=1 Tax=Nguyenibacter vanlangensis TaxID=1216886 RepID=A0ABZ3D1Q2_9PROT
MYDRFISPSFTVSLTPLEKIVHLVHRSPVKWQKTAITIFLAASSPAADRLTDDWMSINVCHICMVGEYMATRDMERLFAEVAELKSMMREILERLPPVDRRRVPAPSDIRQRVEAVFQNCEVSAADIKSALGLDDMSTMEIGRQLTASGMPKRRTAAGALYRVGDAARGKLGRPVEMPDDIDDVMEKTRARWRKLRLPETHRAVAYGIFRDHYPKMRATPAQCAELVRRYPDVVR